MKIKRRVHKKRKILLLTIISIVLLLGGLNLINRSTAEYIQSQYEDKLLILSDLISQRVDGDKLNAFIESNKIEFDFYDEVNSLLLKVVEKFPGIESIYIITETEKPNIWKVVLTTDVRSDDQIPEKTLKVSDEYEVYLGSVTRDNRICKEKYNFASIYTPIHDRTGKQVAVLGLDIDENFVVDWMNSIFHKINLFFIGAILVFGGISLWIINERHQYMNLFLKEARDISSKKERLRFSEGLNCEWDLLGFELNKILEQYWQEKVEREAYIKEIIREKDDIFYVYKDVIEAVTHGRILLLSREKFMEMLGDIFPLYTKKLVDIKDIPNCRTEVDHFMKSKGFSWWYGKNRRDILLCLSEATTNVIKHAGSGEVLLTVINNKLIIFILDNGGGIDLKNLPYTIFINGFSTKESSLGAGLLLMEKLVDRIRLSTTKEGTFLALEKEMDQG